MISSALGLDLADFTSKIASVESAWSGLKLSPLSIGVTGAQDTHTAISNMRAAFESANTAGAGMASNFARAEGALHGLAAVARTTSAAMRLMPKMFAGLPPAVGKTLSSVSLASRAFDVFRGRISPLGGAMAYLEMRNLGVAKSYAALTATMAVASSAVAGSARKIASAVGGVSRGALSGLAASFSGLLGPMAAAGGAFIGVAAAIGGIGKAVGEAANMETLSTAFIPLLGSVDAARARMAELAKFAAETPFGLEGAAKASRTLEVLTKGALSTGAGLRMVGDVASGTNMPFEDLAMWIGRLYDGLQNGRPVGEAMMRLQEMGAIAGDTRAQIEAMQKGGAAGSEIWTVAAGALGRYSGAMKAQSITWNGLLSNLSDNVQQAMATFGAPILDALQPYVEKIIEFVEGLQERAEGIGQAFASGINFVTEAFAGGKIWDLARAGLEAAFLSGINLIAKHFAGLGALAMSVITTAFGNAVKILSIVTTADFWKGLGSVLLGIAVKFAVVITDGIASMIEQLEGIPLIGEKIKGAAAGLRAFGRENSAPAGAVAKEGGAKLLEMLSPLNPLKGVMDAGAAYADAFSKTEGVVEVGDDFGKIAKEIADQSKLSAARRAEEKTAALNATAGGKPGTGTFEFAGPTSKAKSFELASIGGYGLFMRQRQDPLIAATQSQTKVLEQIAENTKQKPASSIDRALKFI